MLNIRAGTLTTLGTVSILAAGCHDIVIENDNRPPEVQQYWTAVRDSAHCRAWKLTIVMNHDHWIASRLHRAVFDGSCVQLVLSLQPQSYIRTVFTCMYIKFKFHSLVIAGHGQCPNEGYSL